MTRFNFIAIFHFILYLQIIRSDDFKIVRYPPQNSRYFNYTKAPLDKHQISKLFCFTNSINDAIVWNTHLEWFNSDCAFRDRDALDKAPEFFHNGKHVTKKEHQLNVQYFPKPETQGWKRVNSFIKPMGPVFDSLWETFEEHNTFEWTSGTYKPVPKHVYGLKSNLTFSEDGTLVVSIRGGANAHFLLCDGANHNTSSCYWIIIGGWGNKRSIIRRCPGGVTGIPPNGECSTWQAFKDHVPLSDTEWRTFVITWNTQDQILTVYDPNKVILQYKDEIFYNDHPKHLFFGNSEQQQHPMQFRFHEYHYKFTSELDSRLAIGELDINSNGELCLDMIISLCFRCHLQIDLLDIKGNWAEEFSISVSAPTQVEHNLPMWQHQQVRVKNLNRSLVPLTLHMKTYSEEPGLHHFALRGIRECLPEGSIKMLKMTASEDVADYKFWPKVTCQKLSYKKSQTGVIDPMLQNNFRAKSPPGNLTLCPKNRIGPYCNLYCDTVNDSGCNGRMVCGENNECYCTQGYTSENCGSRCNSGYYGYGCKNQCDTCLQNNCSIYTGLCKAGCNKLKTGYQYVPPYCKKVVRFPELKYDQMDSTTLRVYFVIINQEVGLNVTYEFEIKANGDTQQKQPAESGDEDGTPIYFTTFNNLRKGMRYKSFIWERVEYQLFDESFSHKLVGDPPGEILMCIWAQNFTITAEDTHLTIQKHEHKDSYSCPNDWYSLSVFPKNSEPDHEIFEKEGEFPRNVTNLEEDTEYVIVISGSTSSFQYRQEVSTLPRRLSAVENFGVKYVNTTGAFAIWSPPSESSARIQHYSLTVKPLHFQGCRVSSSLSSFSLRTYNVANTSDRFMIEDLIPYVTYETTISAYYKRPGIEESTNFATMATEIPTAIYENVTFEDGVIRWSHPLVNCSTITGPIRATRLFFVGLSENVKNFSNQNDTESDFFETNVPPIFGSEKYRVRIHALRSKEGKHNESAYVELNITTKPRPPPKVMNLTIVEVDTTKKTVFLRWKPPQPPANGKISNYKVKSIRLGSIPGLERFVGPKRGCPLWERWICAEVSHPIQSSGSIYVWAKNENTSEYGEPMVIADTGKEAAPDPPAKVDVSMAGDRKIELHWKHPFRTGGPMKSFIIRRELQSTRLIKKLNATDYLENIQFDISEYETIYSTQLSVLPSTSYKIHIYGLVITPETTMEGNSSSIEIKTRSSFRWLEETPSYSVDNSTPLIELTIPSIADYTRNGEIHVVVFGESTPCSRELPASSENWIDDIIVDGDEVPWYVGHYTNLPLSISIGSYSNDDTNRNCHLHIGTPYIIALVIRENGVKQAESTSPIVWRSEKIQIGPKSRVPHEVWIVPLLIFIIIIVGLVFYLIRKRKRIGNSQTDIIIDIPQYVAPLREIEESGKQSHIKSPSPVVIKQRPETVEYRESIRLTPAVSLDQLKPTPIGEEKHDEMKCTSLVKLNEFQDYVKRAIASDKLNEQYSLFPRGQTRAWDYGELPENRKKNRYGNLFAYDETRVILEKLPDDPHSDYINANYIKGYKKDHAYIATQGPKPSTIIDFWRMIWQEEVRVICMLANIKEDGKIRCEQYWPEIGKIIKYGNVSVANVSHEQFADYTFRIFHIKIDQEIRKVTHLHYTAWPDHGVPLYTQSVVAYLKKLLATPAGHGPILVHCSAGVGRTGTIILCDICLRRAAADGVVDVFGETDEMRKQRANMVDNKQQYILAHVALVECLLSLPTAIPCNDLLPTRIQEYKKQLSLQQQGLEQSAWQDEALQSSTRLQLKLSEKNIAKNRFSELLPHSRLFIPRYPITDDDSSYIHGVFVDSARHQNSFIATQLPMPETMADFWRMVIEFRVELIIILQPPDTEDPTCCKFVPGPDEDISVLPSLNLKGRPITDGEHSTQQKICLTDNLTKSPREQTITILTCKEWEAGRDKPPPKPETLVNLWQVAEKISRNEEPTVVICHDGITGCGLYLAMSFLLERMGLEHECDVCFAVRAIRRSRTDFCQSRDQFEYLYDAALIYNGFFETYANFT